jgi:hypothetical protein
MRAGEASPYIGAVPEQFHSRCGYLPFTPLALGAFPLEHLCRQNPLRRANLANPTDRFRF